VLFAVVFLFSWAASERAYAAASHQTGLLFETHPLAGRIFDIRTMRPSSRAAVRDEVGRTPLVLLGETHDNPVHHAQHVELLEAAATQGRRPALVMEQFDRAHQAAINTARHALMQDAQLMGEARRKFLHEAADAIATAGQLNRTSWKWPQYQPLVETAINLDLPLVAGNLSRAEAREVFRRGFAAMPVMLDAALWQRTWNPARDAAVRDTMKAGHCGQLPDSMAPGMVNAQRARDALMAEAIAPHAATGAVLIAGRGHVRRDVGVPLYISDHDPHATMLVIGFIEVAEGKNSLADYTEIQSTLGRPFDIVWFTPRQSRPDPCAGLSLDKLTTTTPEKPARP
jgi:uncharacterized iron-regulated protein